jgi:hypothetical protein
MDNQRIVPRITRDPVARVAFSRSPVPHDPHATSAVIRAPPIQGPRPPQLPKDRAFTSERRRYFDPGIKRLRSIAWPAACLSAQPNPD